MIVWMKEHGGVAYACIATATPRDVASIFVVIATMILTQTLIPTLLIFVWSLCQANQLNVHGVLFVGMTRTAACSVSSVGLGFAGVVVTSACSTHV